MNTADMWGYIALKGIVEEGDPKTYFSFAAFAHLGVEEAQKMGLLVGTTPTEHGRNVYEVGLKNLPRSGLGVQWDWSGVRIP